MAARNTDDADAGKVPKRPKPGNGRKDGVGDALRTVYGDTLGEDIPAEMLALLSKLD